MLAAGVLVAPAVATGDTGGTGSGGATFAVPPDVVGGAALYARSQSVLGATLNFRGATSPSTRVAIQRLDPALGTWTTVASATADGQGNYVAPWRTDRGGLISVRVAPAASSATARAAAAAPTITVTVYRPAVATWYGPGFYGKRTACGQRLTSKLVGIAHRGLACGRSVQVLYKGRTAVLPVVDRGPFRRGTTWDLTAAAAQQLGLTRTDRIATVTLPLTAPAPTTAAPSSVGAAFSSS